MHVLCANVIIKNNYIKIKSKNKCETHYFLKGIDKILFFSLSLWHQTINQYSSMDINQKTGLAIVQLRKEQGISQYNLAIKANITFRYLSDIENGKRNLSLNILEKIATALGVKVSNVLEIAENIE